MATKEAQLKIRSGGVWDVINPKTTITAITGLSSTLSSINADLLNSGTVGTSATPATGDYLLISDADASTAHAVRKGIQINTAGTRFLKESGVWADVNPTTVATALGSATHTLGANQRNCFCACTYTSAAQTLTIDTVANAGWNIGDEITLMRTVATYDVSIAPGSGVTLYSEGNKRKINAAYQLVTLKMYAPNTWVLFGALKA